MLASNAEAHVESWREAAMKKALFVIAALAVILGLANLHGPSPCWAWTPPSYYSPTTVDGNYIGEWNLTSDFFANMYRAGNPTKQIEAKAYLRYDCVPNTLYVLVLTEPGVPALAAGWESAAWAAIGTVSNKVYTGMSGDDGIPPDFAWVDPSPDGLTARGYEASFQLDPGTWSIIIHIEVFDSSASQTSATAGFPRELLPLTIVCEGVHPPAIHVNNYVSLDNQATWIEATIPPGPTVVEGTKLYFKFVVTNSVNVTLYNITLTDTVYGNFTDPFNIYTISPPLPSSLGPDASYTGIIGPITATGTGLHFNTATDSGSDGVTTVTESQDLYYTVIAAVVDPSITVQKYVSVDDLTYLDANEAPGPGVVLGAPVWFKFIVTNNGNEPLSNIQLTDNVYDLGGINPPLPSPFTLDPGASYSGVIGPIYEGVGQHTNTANATGEYNNITYSDTDDANFLVISTPSAEPHLKLVKSSWLDMTVVAPDDRADVGDQINYNLLASNDGNVTLTGVTVVDSKVSPLTPQWPGTPGTLLLGESVTFTGSYTLTQADIDTGYVDNTATAGSDQTLPVHAANTQDVPNPHLMLTKVGTLDMTVVNPAGQANVGDKITYTFNVTNTGNVNLTNVTVTDPLVTVVGGPINLAPGTSNSTAFTGSYTLTQADIDAGQVVNSATAHGTPPIGSEVTQSDDETVTITQSPAISVVKIGTLDMTVVAPTTRADAGDKINFTFVVTNTGNITLSNVTVSDSPALTTGPIPASVASLAPGASTTFTGSYTLTQADIDAGKVDDIATATGAPPGGGAVDGTDTQTVNIPQPPAIAVPGVSLWGSVALAALLCSTMAWVLRRKLVRGKAH